MAKYKKELKAILITDIQNINSEIDYLMNEKQRLQKLDSVSLELAKEFKEEIKDKIAKIENSQHKRSYNIERQQYEKEKNAETSLNLGLPVASLISIVPSLIGVGGIIGNALNQSGALPLYASIPLVCSWPACLAGVQLFLNRNIVADKILTSFEQSKLSKLERSLCDVNRVVYYKEQGKRITQVLEDEIENLQTKRRQKLNSFAKLVENEAEFEQSK